MRPWSKRRRRRSWLKRLRMTRRRSSRHKERAAKFSRGDAETRGLPLRVSASPRDGLGASCPPYFHENGGHPVLTERRALYAAFDRFPSRKGAGVHIARFARALFDWAGGGVLYALGGDDLPAWQSDDDVEIVRFSMQVDNFLERTLAYGRRLDALLEEMPRLEIAHVRDPWSGLP